MKKIRTASTLGVFNFFRLNKLFLIHYLTFLIAFIFGVLSVALDFAFVDNEFNECWSNLINSGFVNNFFSFFLFCVILSLSFLISAFYAFGSPICIILFSLFGLGNGCLFSVVCRELGYKGILINIVLFLLPSIVLFFIYLLLSGAAVSVSNSLALIVLNRYHISDLDRKIKDLIILFFVAVVFSAISSAVRAIFISVFFGVLYV